VPHSERHLLKGGGVRCAEYANVVHKVVIARLPFNGCCPAIGGSCKLAALRTHGTY
jgi:hypothetical protein